MRNDRYVIRISLQQAKLQKKADEEAEIYAATEKAVSEEENVPASLVKDMIASEIAKRSAAHEARIKVQQKELEKLQRDMRKNSSASGTKTRSKSPGAQNNATSSGTGVRRKSVSFADSSSNAKSKSKKSSPKSILRNQKRIKEGPDRGRGRTGRGRGRGRRGGGRGSAGR